MSSDIVVQNAINRLINEERFLNVDVSPDKALDKLESILYKRATEKEMTVDIKTHRLLRIPEDDEILLMQAIEQSPALQVRFQEEGITYKQEITTKQHLPDTELAKWIHTLIRGQIRLKEQA